MRRKRVDEYSAKDTKTLVRMWTEGASRRQIGEALERSITSVESKIRLLRGLGYNLPIRDPEERGRLSSLARLKASELAMLEPPVMPAPAVDEWPAPRFEDDPRVKTSKRLPIYVPTPWCG